MQADRTPWSALAMAVIIGSFSPALGPAWGQQPPSVARGKELAERLCAGCHRVNDNQGGIVQGTDVPSFRALALRPQQTPESLRAFIMTPRHPMPAIPLELNEIRDVAAYIGSLK